MVIVFVNVKKRIFFQHQKFFLYYRKILSIKKVGNVWKKDFTNGKLLEDLLITLQFVDYLVCISKLKMIESRKALRQASNY